MRLNARDWADYSIDDFQISFLEMHCHDVSVEIYLRTKPKDDSTWHYLHTLNVISCESKREAAIEDALAFARSVVNENIQKALRLREREIGPVWHQVFVSQES